ncbi:MULTISPECIES: hypothetical protein [unclassified Sphingomonas]|uniref:hypothetical protein n=1 Tax=unclassified Sphingomonas TaxID=196159 RepID=UPI0012E27C89|nr:MULTISPECIES: hypothetical protein [unclassified Sphingomonas]
MRRSILIAGMAAMLPGQVLAEAAQLSPAGAAEPADDPKEIAEDAARDLTPSRFYNRVGATRADYDAAWQQCRLIARGSRTPSGTIPVVYNPAVISPVAAGAGGLLGGLIAGAIAQGQRRRANRQSCLLIGGWRLVEPDAAAAAQVLAMPEAERIAYLDRQIGAAEVAGKVTERTGFTRPVDPSWRIDAPLTLPGTVFLGKKVDAAAPFVLAPGEAAVVVAFRRLDAASAGRSAQAQLLRYDVEKRDALYRPRDWKAKGDKTIYDLTINSGDKKSPYEVQVLRVTPGDYVLNATSVANLPVTSTNCFGAPMIHVEPGQIAYLGDFVPYMNARHADGKRFDGLLFAGQGGDAAKTLASRQPALAAALTPARWQNRATYGCAGMDMDRYDLPDMPDLPPAPPAPDAPVTG